VSVVTHHQMIPGISEFRLFHFSVEPPMYHHHTCTEIPGQKKRPENIGLNAAHSLLRLSMTFGP